MVVAPEAIEFLPPDSLQLQVSVLNRGSTLLAGAPVTFASEHADVAQVSVVGRVSILNGEIRACHRPRRRQVRACPVGGQPSIVAFDAETGTFVVANQRGWVDRIR